MIYRQITGNKNSIIYKQKKRYIIQNYKHF